MIPQGTRSHRCREGVLRDVSRPGGIHSETRFSDNHQAVGLDSRSHLQKLNKLIIYVPYGDTINSAEFEVDASSLADTANEDSRCAAHALFCASCLDTLECSANMGTAFIFYRHDDEQDS